MIDTMRKFATIFVVIVLLILTVYYYIPKWYCVWINAADVHLLYQVA